jgi:site-specific DNA-methyltransferase (adenine-specific)
MNQKKEMNAKLLLGNNIELLKQLESNSIDSIVTDPPYGLSFMNKKWDYDVPSVDFWKEVYRVLKPGGHVLSFGGTRTYHRMVVNIEDAGFEIRDQIQWIYGSGFPKSLNIGKAVDKINGDERILIEEKKKLQSYGDGINNIYGSGPDKGGIQKITKGNSDFEGWGTALKPANEPICLARKPLSEKSVAENVLKWRTGGINIDGCRVGSENIKTNGYGDKDFVAKEGYEPSIHEGKFPANIILECCCEEVIKGEKGDPSMKIRDRSKHNYNSVGNFGSKKEAFKAPDNYNDKPDIHTDPNCPCYIMDQQSGGHNDSGGASRFFYQAKVSKSERNLGLDEFEDKIGGGMKGTENQSLLTESGNIRNNIMKNTHPTIKPINLMAYLCRLITPTNGTILDPFMGSGSTGIAARLEGFNFVGMEMGEDYFKIAEARIENYQQYKKFIRQNI